MTSARESAVGASRVKRCVKYISEYLLRKPIVGRVVGDVWRTLSRNSFAVRLSL